MSGFDTYNKNQCPVTDIHGYIITQRQVIFHISAFGTILDLIIV